MAADNDIRESHQSHQFIILDDLIPVVFVKDLTLAFVHIQRQPAQLPVLERLNYALGINQSAATRVDQHRAGFHLLERSLVYYVLCLLHERTVQADEVRRREESVEIRVGAVFLELGILIGIVSQDGAAEAVEDASESHANLACAYHADCLSMKGLAEETIQIEVALSHSVESAVCLTVQGLN